MIPLKYNRIKSLHYYVSDSSGTKERIGIFPGFGMPMIADCGEVTDYNEQTARRIVACLEVCTAYSLECLEEMLRLNKRF